MPLHMISTRSLDCGWSFVLGADVANYGTFEPKAQISAKGGGSGC